MHFRFVFSIYLENFGKISIFIASSDSFNVKDDNIHIFFSLFWLQIINLPALLQNINTRIGLFPRKHSVLQNPDRERTNQSTGICLRLGLPYNKCSLLTLLIISNCIHNPTTPIQLNVFFCSEKDPAFFLSVSYRQF